MAESRGCIVVGREVPADKLGGALIRSVSPPEVATCISIFTVFFFISSTFQISISNKNIIFI